MENLNNQQNSLKQQDNRNNMMKNNTTHDTHIDMATQNDKYDSYFLALPISNTIDFNTWKNSIIKIKELANNKKYKLSHHILYNFLRGLPANRGFVSHNKVLSLSSYDIISSKALDKETFDLIRKELFDYTSSLNNPSVKATL